MIKVLYFARLREQLNTASDEFDSQGIADVKGLVQHLCERGGIWAKSFGEGQTVLSAVNQEVSDENTLIKDGDEVAFFPPVTGG